ncbi:myelocytomatosis oncogene homolog [Myripristis murdjan]|uniref:Myelocytomatosis oncogene homolog n=1 Tax=Myripristis murdjan TaxID=586833 RepID=A0A667Y9V7_9TELE|nr:transcriptional regulator Myc-2-like [Myripristis murdjan]
MLQSFAQPHDWLYSEPLLFDDEFCQSLMKDLQSLPTPPQSPPNKLGLGGCQPLSKEEQLSFVSDILLEDHDMNLGLNYDFFHSSSSAAEKEECGRSCSFSTSPSACLPLALEESDDSLWRCLGGDRILGEKAASSVLSTSPLLSDIDTSIFEEIAGSTLDCQDLLEAQEPSEATSDYGSAGGELSTYSSSDSEEEIDVVTVARRPSSPSPLPSLADLSVRQQRQEEEQRALQRHNFEIQQQHNYAAPCPASPPPSSSSSSSSSSSNKRPRGGDGPSRLHYSSRSSSCASSPSSSTSSSSSSRSQYSSRHSAETEDEEERRRTHNVMERQRRNELKNCFMRLRDNVPELTHNDKASKVVILKKARDCIRGLEDEGQRLRARRDKLREKQEALKAKLERLRS